MTRTSRTVEMAVAALAASLLFTGCGGEGSASPAGGGGDAATQKPMRETQTPMQDNERRMHRGESDSMMGKQREHMKSGDDEPMRGKDRPHMKSSEGKKQM